MIFSVASRDDNGSAVLFGRGSAQWGLFDAGLAGTCTIRVSGDASGMDLDVVKAGSLVWVYPQFGFDHWYGLITDPPRYDTTTDTYTINVLELHGFLGDVQFGGDVSSQYIDIADVAWRAYREGVWTGWGLIVDDTPPATSGHAPKDHGMRGQSLSSIAQTVGERGRAAGVRVTPNANGFVLIEVGMAQLDSYNGALIAPFNVREEQSESGGRSVTGVTVEGEGDFATARDAGARFPGQQVTTGTGDLARSATQQLNNLASPAVSLNFRANVDALSDLRVGSVLPYIRANRAAAPAMYLRVTSITMDEDLLPTEFVMTAQVYESDATTLPELSRGPRQPGRRGTGNAMMRRVREIAR